MKKQGLAATARDGDLRATLEAMRDDLAAAMEDADPAIKAQLSGQLRRVLEDLASLPQERPTSKLEAAGDELAKLRQSKTGQGASAKRSSRKPRETGS
jgi:hypothetical protein